jgi:hypothetical protein
VLHGLVKILEIVFFAFTIRLVNIVSHIVLLKT